MNVKMQENDDCIQSIADDDDGGSDGGFEATPLLDQTLVESDRVSHPDFSPIFHKIASPSPNSPPKHSTPAKLSAARFLFPPIGRASRASVSPHSSCSQSTSSSSSSSPSSGSTLASPLSTDCQELEGSSPPPASRLSNIKAAIDVQRASSCDSTSNTAREDPGPPSVTDQTTESSSGYCTAAMTSSSSSSSSSSSLSLELPIPILAPIYDAKNQEGLDLDQQGQGSQPLSRRFFPELTIRLDGVDYLMNVLRAFGDGGYRGEIGQFFFLVAVDPRTTTTLFGNTIDNYCHHYRDEEDGILYFSFHHSESRYIFKQYTGKLPLRIDAGMKWSLFGDRLEQHRKVDPICGHHRTLYFPTQISSPSTSDGHVAPSQDH